MAAEFVGAFKRMFSGGSHSHADEEPSSPSSALRPPPLDARVDASAVAKGDEKAVAAVALALQTRRFCVLRMAAGSELQVAWSNYREACRNWLATADSEEKKRFAPVRDDVNPRRRNLGYLDVLPTKEFLKLHAQALDAEDEDADSVGNASAAKDGESDESKAAGVGVVPSALRESFAAYIQAQRPLTMHCFRAWARTDVGGETYMEDSFRRQVEGFMNDRSSVAMVRYHPATECDEDDCNNDSNSACPKDELTEPGLIYPSRTHTDTGLMTFIVCSDVPGLQVWDHTEEKAKWLQVEQTYDPALDLFLILGRKAQIFARHGDRTAAFKPTTHRVSLPLNTERYSLLYFVDVPQ